jgi:hypothetical protein
MGEVVVGDHVRGAAIDRPRATSVIPTFSDGTEGAVVRQRRQPVAGPVVVGEAEKLSVV